MRWIFLGMALMTALSLPVDIADKAWIVDPSMWFGLPIIGSVAMDVVVILGFTVMWRCASDD